MNQMPGAGDDPVGPQPEQTLSVGDPVLGKSVAPWQGLGSSRTRSSD